MMTAIMAALASIGSSVGSAASAAGSAIGSAASSVGSAVGSAASSVGSSLGSAGSAIGHAAGTIGGNIAEGAQVAGQGISKGAGQIGESLSKVGEAAQAAFGGGAGAGGAPRAASVPRPVNTAQIPYEAPNIVTPSSGSLTPRPIVQTGIGSATVGPQQGTGIRDYLTKLFGQGGGGGGNEGPGAPAPAGGGWSQGGPAGKIQGLMKGDFGSLMGGGGKGGMGGIKLIPGGPTQDAPPVSVGQVQPFTPYTGRSLPRGALMARLLARRRPMAGPYARPY